MCIFPQSVLCMGEEAEEVVVEVQEEESSEDMGGEGVCISALLDVVCHREYKTSGHSPFQPSLKNREMYKEVRISVYYSARGTDTVHFHETYTLHKGLRYVVYCVHTVCNPVIIEVLTECPKTYPLKDLGIQPLNVFSAESTSVMCHNVTINTW